MDTVEALRRELEKVNDEAAKIIDDSLDRVDYAQSVAMFMAATVRTLENAIAAHTSPEQGRLIEETALEFLRARVRSGELVFPEAKEFKNA